MPKKTIAIYKKENSRLRADLKRANHHCAAFKAKFTKANSKLDVLQDTTGERLDKCAFEIEGQRREIQDAEATRLALSTELNILSARRQSQECRGDMLKRTIVKQSVAMAGEEWVSE